MIFGNLQLRVQADGELKKHSILYVTTGQTWLVLGAQDFRKEYGFAYQFARPDKRLNFRQNKAELVLEVNGMVSTGRRPGRADSIQRNLGLLWIGRYEQGKQGHARSFWEAGWGLEYTNRESGDLSYRWNSAPTLGVGYVVPAGGSEVYVTLRYHHISNAGLKPPNQGQNWAQLMIGYRF